jgi:hypothetical protein
VADEECTKVVEAEGLDEPFVHAGGAGGEVVVGI